MVANWLDAIAWEYPFPQSLPRLVEDLTVFIPVVVEAELVLSKRLMKSFFRKERRRPIKEFSITVSDIEASVHKSLVRPIL